MLMYHAAIGNAISVQGTYISIVYGHSVELFVMGWILRIMFGILGIRTYRSLSSPTGED